MKMGVTTLLPIFFMVGVSGHIITLLILKIPKTIKVKILFIITLLLVLSLTCKIVLVPQISVAPIQNLVKTLVESAF